jgi:RimJ/RimL family protein N-acetyltransferase
VGCTRFGDIDWHHKRLEIGWTWVGLEHQRTAVNTEAKILLMAEAFERLGMVRVQFKTDALNVPSQIAILRLGASYEGTLRSHMQCEDGRVRDTVVFSLLADDWPSTKTHLTARLVAYARAHIDAAHAAGRPAGARNVPPRGGVAPAAHPEPVASSAGMPSAATASIDIRPISRDDRDRVLAITRDVVTEGSTYVFTHETSDEQLLNYWYDQLAHSYVAVVDGTVAGCYVLSTNQTGRGSHVVNGSYMVDPTFGGLSLGRRLAEHSVDSARALGYTAMQFNMVVSTNHNALALWLKMGFQIVGRLPKVFEHPRQGLVDAYVMHRYL